MKKILKIILSFSSFFLLSACSNNTTEDITIENIKASEIRNEFLEETLTGIENEGIYQVNIDNKSYIIFNGLKSEYKNVKVVLKDEVLQILFTKVDSDKSAKQVYEIKPYLSEKFDTIQLIENDKETHFETVYF
ncbi:hypothetical protein [Carnobacterium sp.]|uniref:hypothetical protein n=1 Tax=Carnobacterium sp. TaxID=48221 RepID=UPI003C743637